MVGPSSFELGGKCRTQHAPERPHERQSRQNDLDFCRVDLHGNLVHQRRIPLQLEWARSRISLGSRRLRSGWRTSRSNLGHLECWVFSQGSKRRPKRYAEELSPRIKSTAIPAVMDLSFCAAIRLFPDERVAPDSGPPSPMVRRRFDFVCQSTATGQEREAQAGNHYAPVWADHVPLSPSGLARLG